MILCPNHKAVFVSMPRCATHTIHNVLLTSYGGKQRMESNGGRHPNDVPDECRDWFTWSVVRNPYTRVVSMYRYLRESQGWTFLEYCRMILDRAKHNRQGPLWPMWQQLKGVRVDRLVRFGTLAADLATLPFWRPTELPHMAASTGDDDPWTPETVRIVREWAGEDFGTYGYDRERIDGLANE